MKAKTFENLIRKVVREEIDYALRREIKTLKEDLRDELKPTIVPLLGFSIFKLSLTVKLII